MCHEFKLVNLRKWMLAVSHAVAPKYVICFCSASENFLTKNDSVIGSHNFSCLAIQRHILGVA